jgi:membrane protein YqaA with SNARE-associated domain
MRVSLITTFVLQAARNRPARTGFSAALRHLGAFGLFAFAILDSSPIPTFGGLDVFTAILAARHLEPWYFYAAVSSAGSAIGAFMTFRITRKAGASYFKKKFGGGTYQRLLTFVEHRGAVSLVVATLAPPPFPTSAVLAAAGVMNYPLRRFLTAALVGRVVRYSLIAWAGAKYGRHFVRIVRHPSQYLGWSVLVLGTIVLMAVAAGAVWLWGRRSAPVAEGP